MRFLCLPVPVSKVADTKTETEMNQAIVTVEQRRGTAYITAWLELGSDSLAWQRKMQNYNYTATQGVATAFIEEQQCLLCVTLVKGK